MATSNTNLSHRRKLALIIGNATIKDKGLHEMDPPAGAFIQFACAANHTVSDSSTTDSNGLFIKHLRSETETVVYERITSTSTSLSQS
ncbi:unnamed protein product, partial [Didymodactylos carnosus]